jgi:DNA-binding cell septation regulator SpoVG
MKYETRLFVGNDNQTKSLAERFMKRVREEGRLKKREAVFDTKKLVLQEIYEWKGKEYVFITTETKKSKHYKIYKIEEE